MSFYQKYEIGVRRSLMNAAYAPQRTLNACWAASISNLLNYSDVKLHQSTLSKMICKRTSNGIKIDCPATPLEMNSVLNIKGFDENGNYFQVNARGILTRPNLQTLYRELLLEKPVLVAYNQLHTSIGHAVLITAAECEQKHGWITLTKLYVRDPDPNRGLLVYRGRAIELFLNSIYAHWYPEVTNYGYSANYLAG